MTKLYDKRVFTDDQAIAICLDDRTCEDIADDYGVTRATISRIKHGHRYANVTEHVRDKQAFALKISGLKAERNNLLKTIEAMEKEIAQLESQRDSHPDEIKRKEDLAKYQQLVHGA